MFEKRTVKDLDVDGKRVLVRVDFNVPLDDGSVTDDTRIRGALPTLRYLVDHGAKVILVSHLGRPKGEPDDRFRLDPVVEVLSRLLGRNVYKVDGVVGPEVTEAVSRMVPGEVLILENVRFHPGEKANDPAFAAELADLADLYVNDAFGTAHREHASTAGVADCLPSAAGLLLEREVTTLRGMLENAERPFVSVLGGSKVSDKLAVIDRLLDNVDTLLVGGGMCGVFVRIGLGFGTVNIVPVDFVVASEIAEDVETRIVGRGEIADGMMGLDIGPTTIELFGQAIARARTVFWNGPMGVFELAPFEEGTRQIARAIARNSRAVSVVGGGDSDAALRKYGLEDEMTFVSTGGGASMKLLEGVVLPGVEALDDRR